MQYDLAMEHGPIEKQREFLWRLADAFDKDGRLVEAEEQLQELLDMPLSDEQRLEALCFLAEIQVSCFASRSPGHRLVQLDTACMRRWRKPRRSSRSCWMGHSEMSS